jgi:lipopolysaccharide export system permease protein
VSILQRYIAASLVRGWLLVLLILGAVFGLIAFIQELDHTRFEYDAIAVAQYTLLTLPERLVSLAPVIALLGSIVALASLDKSNELTIISCAGVALRQLLVAIALPTLVLMLLLWSSMEYLTPVLHQKAEQQRHALRHRNDAKIPDGGVWSKNGNRYIHLGKMHENNVPGDISLFEFSDSGALTLALHAQTAQVSAGRRWRFEGVREKSLVDGKLVTRYLPELEISNLWAAKELPTLTLSSDSMTLSVLYGYSQYLASNGRSMQNYLSAFWQKLTMPLTVAAMVLLATPISANLGARRDRNFGVNMGIGALIGILFYLSAQIVFALGQLLELSIPLVAVSPALAVFACALLLLRRVRW